MFARLGIRKSTMDGVARRAGVSRITVYRRFATKDVLAEHVVRRELRRYFDQFLVDIQRAALLARCAPSGATRSSAVSSRPSRTSSSLR